MTQNAKKVLIVEDDPLLRASLEARFDAGGFNVATANNGEAGLEAFFTEKPDAVVMDIRMPLKDGLEMLEDIRKRDPDTKVPFVVLTNSDDLSHVAAAMADDVVAFMPKSEQHIDGIVAFIAERLK